jgi:hypothetical protein
MQSSQLLEVTCQICKGKQLQNNPPCIFPEKEWCSLTSVENIVIEFGQSSVEGYSVHKLIMCCSGTEQKN